MKRCILVSSRINKDPKTGDELLFLTMCRLPNKMNNGGLWHPKKDELVMTACINKSQKPEKYNDLLSVLPGCLIDVTFGLNEFNNKPFILECNVVEGTNIYDEGMLYL